MEDIEFNLLEPGVFDFRSKTIMTIRSKIFLINLFICLLFFVACGNEASNEVKAQNVKKEINQTGYSILFTKQKNRTDNIFLITSDGKTKQITDHRSKDSSPILSTDGKKMVFTSERVGWWKIWLMDVESKSYMQLTNASQAEYGPYFSPNGEKIVFVSDRDGNSEIYVMDLDGKNLINITNNKATDKEPFWANEGKIYYSSKEDGVYQIMSIKADGTDKKTLTNGKGNKHMPQLSPDGKKILFYSEKDGNPEIYTMIVGNEDDITRLTNNPLMDIRPRWSPDGKMIVFERGNKKDNQNIFIMDADGKNQKQLTFEDYNYAPSFVSNESILLAEK
jgi:TolB protein